MAELRLDRLVQIDAPAERAFDVYTDPEKVPEWSGTVRGIDHTEPLGRVGARFAVLWRGRFERTDAEITRFERPTLQEVTIAGRLPYVVLATFAPRPDGGSTLRLEIVIGVPLLLRPFLRLRMQGELANELDRFKALVEDG